MKKVIMIGIALILSFCLTSCSDNIEDNRTLDTIRQAYIDGNYIITDEGIPEYERLKAVDGLTLYINDYYVLKIYEFKSVHARKQAQRGDITLKTWPSNGKFLMETTIEESGRKTFFNIPIE